MLAWITQAITAPLIVFLVVALWKMNGKVRAMSTAQQDMAVRFSDEVRTRDRLCTERLAFLREMNGKLDTVCEDTAAIKGYLKGRNGKDGS